MKHYATLGAVNCDTFIVTTGVAEGAECAYSTTTKSHVDYRVDVDCCPIAVAESDREIDSAILVFHERQIELDRDLYLDLLIHDVDTIFGSGDATDWNSGIVPAGTEINSYFLHFDPIGQQPTSVLNTTATFSFDGEILGLIIDPTSLNDTDIRLAAAGRYMTGLLHGFNLSSPDTVTIFDDKHSVTVHMNVFRDQISQLRIITAVPEPATVSLLTCLLWVLLRVTARNRTRRS